MPFDPKFDDYVSVDSTKLFVEADDSETAKPAGYLLWGDGVRIVDATPVNGRRKVRARGKTGFVKISALGGKSLLEIYFIDVGQGDGLLIKTPDFRHIMIDGGYPRDSQPTRKSAADFVDWKFVKDYASKTIVLDAMLASHCDWDHTGGLTDLLHLSTAGADDEELDATAITVETFHHAGVGWWQKPKANAPGQFDGRWLGAKDPTGKYLVQLLDDRASAEAALAANSAAPLQGKWRDLITAVAASKRASGTPTAIHFATRAKDKLAAHADVFLPGFAVADGDVTIRVLSPVPEIVGGKPALPVFEGGDDKNTNGHSIALRLDYGRTRTLLTGDLNKSAHHHLLELYAGQSLDFQADVSKACHHGSGDVSFRFMQAMSAGVTIISSGDSEGHDHPKPQVVAAAGVSGHLSVENDEVITPLVYSTELARSLNLGDPFKLTSGATTIDGQAFEDARIFFKETKPGDLRATTKDRRAGNTDVVAGLIYGLVNVRTDGSKILCATMNEGNGSFAVRSFKSRF
ncbi:MAG: hypothetical protein Q7T08_08275 [Devosia sp.]|nr:hypothetical protein [Devosia sp.]